MDTPAPDPTRRGSGADLARRTLARPHAAQLLVDGVGAGCEGVELVDRHGVPLLLCDPVSPLARAAQEGRSATLTVAGPPTGPGSPTVLLRGLLVPVGPDRVGERIVERVELRLSQVCVAGGTGSGRIDLDDYLASSGPGIVEYAALVLAHTNTAHGSDLVRFVADLSGTPAGDVAGARLAALDAAGVTVRWVDPDGAYEVRVLFPQRAGCSEQLAALLAQTLCTRC